MKNKWRNYALKDGKVKSCYLREHSYRSSKRKARKASSGNSLLESKEEQIQEQIKVEDAKVRSRMEQGIESQDCQRGLMDECSIPGVQHREERQAKDYSALDAANEKTESQTSLTLGEDMRKEKEIPKEKKHESHESKRYEKREEKKEMKGKKK